MTSQYLSRDANRRSLLAFNKFEYWWWSMQLSWIHCAGNWLPQRKRGGCTSHKTVNISWILTWKVKIATAGKGSHMQRVRWMWWQFISVIGLTCSWHVPPYFYCIKTSTLKKGKKKRHNYSCTQTEAWYSSATQSVGARTVSLIAVHVMEYFLVCFRPSLSIAVWALWLVDL